VKSPNLRGSFQTPLPLTATPNRRTWADPRHPERSGRLVKEGVYRIGRNPMYLGFVAVLLGLAVALLSPIGLALALATAAYLDRFRIQPEERMLRRHFGRDESYRRTVPRWL
jgi:protein-S-isoprenylcysteine O-methyltransferase Ste14